MQSSTAILPDDLMQAIVHTAKTLETVMKPISQVVDVVKPVMEEFKEFGNVVHGVYDVSAGAAPLLAGSAMLHVARGNGAFPACLCHTCT